VVLTLLVGLWLAAFFSHRALLLEQRAAATQVRAAQALHAAEAGRDWAIAWLNHPAPIDAACQPLASAAAAAPDASWRARYVGLDASSGILGPPDPARPGCVFTGGTGWACHCPTAGEAALPRPDPTTSPGERPAFALGLESGPQPGSLRLSVTGCSGVGSGCGGSGTPEAQVELRLLLQTLGGLMRLPVAALESAGPVALGPSATLVNTDVGSGGLTVQGGASVAVDPLARLVAPPGRPPAASLVQADATLAGGSDALLRRHFGLAPAVLRELPSWRRIACPGGCSDAPVTEAIAQGQRALWLDGPLAVSSEVHWGSAARPVLLLVRGPVTLTGPQQIQGLIVADGFNWQHPGSGSARLTGGVISTGASRLSGPVQLLRDAATLLRLRDLPGAFLPVPGSWQDFDTP
jgi:hypothetical protein